MIVKKWRVVDPFDTNETTKTWFFPLNPATMTSPYGDRSVQSMTTTRGTTLLTEGGTPAKAWEFGGPILDKDHLDKLLHWTYEKPGRLVIQDHFGRKLNTIWTSLDVVPKRRNGSYYSHDYTVHALVYGISAPDVPNGGPT